MKKINVLIGCECSGEIRDAFTALGHFALSCDLKPSEKPGNHYQGNIFDIIESERAADFHLFIAHPPCTFTASSGVQWLSHPADRHLPFEDRREHPLYPGRRNDMYAAVKFARRLYDCKIPFASLENPIGKLSTLWRKPDQIIQPWQFGDSASKSTCLWLRGLPKLTPTNIVDKGEFTVFSSGKKQPKWYADSKKSNKAHTQALRSKTFPGIAQAMAEQYSNFILNNL